VWPGSHSIGAAGAKQSPTHNRVVEPDDKVVDAVAKGKILTEGET
jgi:hypothetical protein